MAWNLSLQALGFTLGPLPYLVVYVPVVQCSSTHTLPIPMTQKNPSCSHNLPSC